MTSIEERLDKLPESWKPSPGEKLVGTVVELDERTSEYGSYPAVTLETGDGSEVVFHAFHTVAKEELARKRPTVGDEVGVVYYGRDEAKGYESYRIVVERHQLIQPTPTE